MERCFGDDALAYFTERLDPQPTRDALVAVLKLAKRNKAFDDAYSTAPFLHVAGDLGLRVVARLKGNLPQLFAAAQGRFSVLPPSGSFENGSDRVEFWDYDEFDPWETLRWKSIRVLRYCQHRRDGTVIEAYWLIDWPTKQVGVHSLYKMAKSRWEIENQGFNDGKNRYGLEYLGHHHENSFLMRWLLALLAIVIERLYRLRYLKRGTHPPYSPIAFLRQLRLALGSRARAP